MRRETPGQTELTLLAPDREAPEATHEEVQKVVGILALHGQQTAADIAGKMGLEPTENNKRKVRAIARASRPGIVSFPNSNGYKLWEQCTVEELRACVAHWRSVERDAAQTALLFQNRLFSTFGSNA